jgi:Tol biopolymer transport system component/DNA-binding winged helix-turn-helix (wHTH) protein
MPASTQPIGSFRFGPFIVDTPAGQLRKGASKIRLAGQPFEILVMLLERSGQVVTREEIQQRLWPQETFVDFENSLNKAINKLRQALSDSADKPIYVETLPRRGYRFVGTLLSPITEVPETPHTASSTTVASPSATASPTPSSSRSFSLWRIAALSFLLPLSSLAWLAIRPLAAPRVVGVVPLTTSSRADLFGGLHTDGVRLFFLLRRGHKWDLSQMPSTGGEVQPISLPFSNARIFSVSPDGSQFALGPFDVRAPALPVFLMSSVGGTPRRLGDFLANDATFSRDGAKITYSTQEGIFNIDLDGAKGHKLLDIPGSKWGLAWSPDGARLRFHWANSPASPSRIWEIRSDGSNLHQLLPTWTGADGVCCGRWTADGKYFVFLASSGSSPSAVWALREPSGWFRRSQLPTLLATGPLPVSVVLPSADSKRIFVLGNNARSEFVHIDPQTHEMRGLLAGQPVAWATIAPGGGWAAFRGAGNGLWRSKLDGSAAVELVSGKFDPGLPAIRPNGKVIAFRGQPPAVASSRIYTVSSDGGEPTEIASSSFPLTSPAWSPDGTKLSYAVDADENSASGIYVFDFSTKSTLKIPSSEKYWKHRWSPDGKFLACDSVINDEVSLFEFATKKWKTVARGKVIGPSVWSEDSRFLFFQDLLEPGEPVRRLRLSDFSTDRAFECSSVLEGGVQRCGFEGLAPDGSFLFQLSRGDHDVFAIDVDLP